jgi:hypothetical protein
MRKDLSAIVLMMAVITLFFLPVLLPGNMFYYRDVIFEAYPLSTIIKESFDSGTLPFWNPYIGFGQPLLASPSAQIIYPSTILRILFTGPIAFKWHVILHSWWAATGMFLLCRHFGLSRIASMLGGFGFVFAGPFVSYMNFVMQVATASWMPWIFLALDRALSNWSTRRSLIFGAALGLQLLAGEAVTCIQTIIFSFLYAAVIYGNWRKPLARENGRIVATFLIAEIYGLMLSAVYILPFLRYISLGDRSVGLPSMEANAHSLHPLFIIDLVAPKFLFNHMFDPYTATDYSPWTKTLNGGYPSFLLCIYLGAAHCSLALLGSIRGEERRQRFFAVSAVVAILIALGSYTHLFDALRLALPIFKTMRFPIKFLLPASFALSLLASYGLEKLRRTAATQRWLIVMMFLLMIFLAATLLFSTLPLEANKFTRDLAAWIGIEDTATAAEILVPIARMKLLRTLVILTAILSAVTLLGRKRNYADSISVLILVLSVLELSMANYDANPVISSKPVSLRPELLKLLPYPREDYRVISTSESNAGGLETPQLLPDNETGQETLVYYTRCLMLPYDNINYRIYTGIDYDKLQMYPREYAEVENFIYKRDKTNIQLIRLLGRLNTRFIISQHELKLIPGLRYAGEAFNYSVEPTRIYEIENYLPQTYIATRLSYLPAGKTTVERLAGDQFSDRQEAILNDEAAPKLPAIESEADTITTSRIVERTLRSFVVETEQSLPGYLVAMQHFMPGWKAKIDGKPVEIYRTNQIFMGVRLEPGRHRVEFSYLPSEFLIGLVISLLALATGTGTLMARKL